MKPMMVQRCTISCLKMISIWSSWTSTCGQNGLLLARELREQASVALMFLTGRDNEVDKILGTEIGADDYITKPFNPRELTIRARNLLSRTMNPGSTGEERRGRELQVQRLGAGHQQPLADQPGRRTVQAAAQQFRAMLHFCENPGKIQSVANC